MWVFVADGGAVWLERLWLCLFSLQVASVTGHVRELLTKVKDGKCNTSQVSRDCITSVIEDRWMKTSAGSYRCAALLSWIKLRVCWRLVFTQVSSKSCLSVYFVWTCVDTVLCLLSLGMCPPWLCPLSAGFVFPGPSLSPDALLPPGPHSPGQHQERRRQNKRQRSLEQSGLNPNGEMA